MPWRKSTAEYTPLPGDVSATANPNDDDDDAQRFQDEATLSEPMQISQQTDQTLQQPPVYQLQQQVQHPEPHDCHRSDGQQVGRTIHLEYASPALVDSGTTGRIALERAHSGEGISPKGSVSELSDRVRVASIQEITQTQEAAPALEDVAVQQNPPVEQGVFLCRAHSLPEVVSLQQFDVIQRASTFPQVVPTNRRVITRQPVPSADPGPIRITDRLQQTVSELLMPVAPTRDPFVPNWMRELNQADLEQVKTLLYNRHLIQDNYLRHITRAFWISGSVEDEDTVMVLLYRGQAIYLNTIGDSLEMRHGQKPIRKQMRAIRRRRPMMWLRNWHLKDMIAPSAAFEQTIQDDHPCVRGVMRWIGRFKPPNHIWSDNPADYRIRIRPGWTSNYKPVIHLQHRPRGAHIFMTSDGHSLPMRDGLYHQLLSINNWERAGPFANLPLPA